MEQNEIASSQTRSNAILILCIQRNKFRIDTNIYVLYRQISKL